MAVRQLEYARHREPQKPVTLDPGGGVSPEGIRNLAKREVACACATGVSHGAVVIDEREFCSTCQVTLENTLGSGKTHNVTFSADDEWWESADITAQLLATPGELDSQVYRLRLTQGDPDEPRTAMLILYRVEPEDPEEDDFAELIPAGPENPLCSWKNSTHYEPLYGFKLDRFRRVDPDLGLTFKEGCKVCVGVVPSGTIPEDELTSCMTTYVTPSRDGKPLPRVLYVRNEEGGQVTGCTWDAESHKWRGPLQLTTIGDLQAMEQFEIECGGIQSGLGIERTITSGDPHFFTLTTGVASGPHGPLVNRSQTYEVELKDGEGNTLDTFVGAVLTVFEIEE